VHLKPLHPQPLLHPQQEQPLQLKRRMIGAAENLVSASLLSRVKLAGRKWKGNFVLTVMRVLLLQKL